MEDYYKYIHVFSSEREYQIFYWAMGFLFLSEFLIWLFTSSWFARKGAKHNHSDITMWIVIIGWCSALYVPFYFAENKVVAISGTYLLPHIFYYIGVICLIFGTILRDLSVWTLKRAFTLNVQTTDDQHLIQNGFYRIVRNPAYTGSILSLVGVALCMRNLFSPFIVIGICIICYGIRIIVEEKALTKQFGEEFLEYKKYTWRLFPYIW